MPVGGDEARHRIEHLGGLVRVGHQLVHEVAHLDPCCEEALHALFGRLSRLDVADVIGDYVGSGEAGLGKQEVEEDSSGMLGRVLLMVLSLIKD